MTVEKLKSGSYRYKQMYKGKNFSFTSAKKLKQAEAQQILFDLMKEKGYDHAGIQEQLSMTFKEAADKYNLMKEPVLSPSTIKDYVSMPGRISEGFKKLKLREITLFDVQNEINRYTPEHSSKTVKNFNGYIQSVMKAFLPEFNGFKIDIKPTVKEEPYIPTTDEIRQIVQAAKGTPYEMTVGLACYGLRRSEAACITAEDLDGDTVRITKSYVQNKNKEWVIKEFPKTGESIRTVNISHELAEMIREKGKACTFHPGNTLRWLHRTCNSLNIKQFQLHKIRHWVATELSQLGIPDVDILAYCGWSRRGDVMRTIYRHSRLAQEKEKAKAVESKLTGLIN